MTLRVAYLLTRYPQVSETFVSNEVAELRRQGVLVDVVALERGTHAPAQDDAVLYLDEVRAPRALAAAAHAQWALRHPRRYQAFRRVVHELGSEMGVGRNLVPWQRLPQVATRLRRDGVQVLHAHFAWSGAAAAQALAALTGLPWSVTVHANDLWSRPRNLEAKLAAADQLVTVCAYNVRWLREHTAVQGDVPVVVCGVEVPDVAPQPAEVDVLAVGRLVPKKGFDTLVRAAALLRERRPGLSVEIVGEGSERAALESLVAELNLAATVRLRGALPHAAVLDRISAARTFALPARVAADGSRDSMPVVIKEAMARRVPVVATSVVAIPEMVDDEVGRLVPVDDPSALADAIDELLGDDALRERLGSAGRERVADRFTLAGEVAKLRELLQGLARRG